MGQIKNIKLHIVTDIKYSPNQYLELGISRHKFKGYKTLPVTKMKYLLCTLAILPALVMVIDGKTCTTPSVSTETAYVIEFSVNCKDDVKGFNLYAELEVGVLVPVALVPDSNNYQISWIKDHKKAQTGSISIKMFDDGGQAAYRKAQRNNDDVTEVAPLFTVQINHPGIAKEGLFVQTEFIAVVTALLVWWGGNTMRNQIME